MFTSCKLTIHTYIRISWQTLMFVNLFIAISSSTELSRLSCYTKFDAHLVVTYLCLSTLSLSDLSCFVNELNEKLTKLNLIEYLWLLQISWKSERPLLSNPMHKCGRKKWKKIKRKIHFPFNWGLSKCLRLHHLCQYMQRKNLRLNMYTHLVLWKDSSALHWYVLAIRTLLLQMVQSTLLFIFQWYNIVTKT